jgi:hypothetical protein
MTGSIVGVSVGWAVDASGSPRQITVDLEAIRKCCRPERVDELLADLALICQDVQTAQDAGTDSPLPRSMR